MQPTIEILDRIRKNSRDNKEEIFTRLYRYLLRPDLYYLAYKNLYANKGAGTKGVNDDTADGFSKEKVDRIIQSLADGTYTPNPVRREYIQKKQNSTKKRPLGIPTFTDKLVQEVLRMILESVYEPIFSNNSHGFRPNRSCHTALKSLKREFSGVSWFIEGDIKGCFDNIDHQVLANVINAKIKDARLIQLIWKFLKAGYMEDWQYHATYSGCPQGGIVSPILANIYLNELDKFVEKTAKEFYYQLATCISLDCRDFHRRIMTVLTNRLNTETGCMLLREGGTATEAEKERFGNSKMIRYVAGIDQMIYPIAYIKNKIPMAKRSAVCSYTADGRAIIHSNLQLNPFVLKGLREDTSNRHSTEYHDCKLSLFSAQKGKCAISGDEFTNATDIVAWLKTPKYMGGFERYKNMTLIHKKYLILLEKLPQAELKAYLKSLNVTKKMLGKINSLRERAGLLAII